MSLATFFSSITVLLFVMDPFGNLPIVASIMEKVPPTQRRKVLLRELILSLGILISFFFLGGMLLDLLGVEASTLDIAGGVILLFVSIHLIFPSPNHSFYSSDDSEPFIVPIAVPLIAGPSAMTIVILMATRSETTTQQLWALGAVVIAWALLAVILMAFGFFQRILRPKGLRACERLMGMLLILVAIQSILNGLREYIKTL
ncbi:MAG: NAAT family transporter [Phycisphaerales bacterium]|nr:NAAT family transporter [Phycisphaerales bacterium]MBT7170546.1 NAAT family transporter [Phycisphaerales bacterium]